MEDGLPPGGLIRLEHRHSVRVQLSVDHPRNRRRGDHESSRARGSNVKQRARMKSWNDKRVPLGRGNQGRKCDRIRVLVDDFGGHGALHNAAEDALCVETHAAKYDSRIRARSDVSFQRQNALMIVKLPDDTAVYAQGRLGLIPSDRIRTPDYAVYLDERWAADPDVTWPFRMIDWPDFGVPENESELFDAIVEIHARAKVGEVVEIACYGGLGRTGTVLSCLAVCAGVPASDAVEWVRSNYDRRAVETEEQQQLVEAFATSL